MFVRFPKDEGKEKIEANLENEHEADEKAKIRGRAIESAHDRDGSLSNGDDHGQHCRERKREGWVTGRRKRKEEGKKKYANLTLLGSIEQLTILLHTLVNLQNSGTSQHLHNHSRGDDGGDTQLHEGSPVGSENNTEPVERIRILRRQDSKERDLTEHKEDEQGHCSPHDLLLELDLWSGK